MATLHETLDPNQRDAIDYPTRDGRPMGETDRHRNEMFAAIDTLKLFYQGQEVYVSGNILVFCRPGNKRKHISPDVLVVKGVSPVERDNYLVWMEGKSPNLVIEVTSPSTKDEDEDEKMEIYQDILKVPEYFLFDPRSEYLRPSLQGYRLLGGRYVPIEAVDGRLPSEELGLHLERRGTSLRLYDPRTGAVLLTPEERRNEAEAALRQSEAENERLRRELDLLRQQRGSST